MDQKNNHHPADMLQHIQKVDAPPFLLTRIRQKIAAVQVQRIAPAAALAGCLSLALILALNIYVVSGGSGRNHAGHSRSDLARAMNLYPNNALYQ